MPHCTYTYAHLYLVLSVIPSITKHLIDYTILGNLPPHTPERHALDLAGSREQRGSAFELYRKPQIGAAVGHHHNMR